MPLPLKPPALKPGDAVRVISTASPIREPLFDQGCAELMHLGYIPVANRAAVLAHQSFFAGPAQVRASEFLGAVAEESSRAIFAARGGYGSNYLLDAIDPALLAHPKILLGCSDVSSLQIFLWQTRGWVTFYGPMVATNFSRGSGAAHGYDRSSLTRALTDNQGGWQIDLQAEPLAPAHAGAYAEGRLLGGCLTLVEATLGTPWELQTAGSILVLEDRGEKPYQVDRALMHLKQAGKFREVAAIILGDFPDCEPAAPTDETARDVARRIFEPLGIPVIWGSPIGHTERPMLTIPLGVHARLASGSPEHGPSLEIVEPACA
jgi:muramoyltetrapeptide carboxypeptidase